MAFQPLSVEDERLEHLPRLERSILFGADSDTSSSEEFKYLRVDPLKFDIARIMTSTVAAKDCNFPIQAVRYVAGIQKKEQEVFLVCLRDFFQEHSGCYRVKKESLELINLDSVIGYQSLLSR